MDEAAGAALGGRIGQQVERRHDAPFRLERDDAAANGQRRAAKQRAAAQHAERADGAELRIGADHVDRIVFAGHLELDIEEVVANGEWCAMPDEHVDRDRRLARVFRLAPKRDHGLRQLYVPRVVHAGERHLAAEHRERVTRIPFERAVGVERDVEAWLRRQREFTERELQIGRAGPRASRRERTAQRQRARAETAGHVVKAQRTAFERSPPFELRPRRLERTDHERDLARLRFAGQRQRRTCAAQRERDAQAPFGRVDERCGRKQQYIYFIFNLMIIQIASDFLC